MTTVVFVAAAAARRASRWGPGMSMAQTPSGKIQHYRLRRLLAERD
ncbi:hypothetical protein ACWEOE_14895 [Amycolatopsis sp. NPDC004368]